VTPLGLARLYARQSRCPEPDRAKGAAFFRANCVQCHGVTRQGGTAPLAKGMQPQPRDRTLLADNARRFPQTKTRPNILMHPDEICGPPETGDCELGGASALDLVPVDLTGTMLTPTPQVLAVLLVYSRKPSSVNHNPFIHPIPPASRAQQRRGFGAEGLQA